MNTKTKIQTDTVHSNISQTISNPFIYNRTKFLRTWSALLLAGWFICGDVWIWSFL